MRPAVQPKSVSAPIAADTSSPRAVSALPCVQRSISTGSESDKFLQINCSTRTLVIPLGVQRSSRTSRDAKILRRSSSNGSAVPSVNATSSSSPPSSSAAMPTGAQGQSAEMDVSGDFGDDGTYDDASVEVEVPVKAGKMDILAAVASVLPSSPTTTKTKSAAPVKTAKSNKRYDDDEEEKEAEFDENEHTASSSDDSYSSSDSSSSESDSDSSESGLSDTDSETEGSRRKSAPFTPQRLKKRALPTSSRDSSAERPTKKKTSPGKNISREVLNLYKETNPPPRGKAQSPPKAAAKASPKASQSQAKSSAKSDSSSSSKTGSKSGNKTAHKSGTKAAADPAEQMKEKMELLMSSKSDEDDLVEVLIWISNQVHARKLPSICFTVKFLYLRNNQCIFSLVFDRCG